jgi:hypothetical protein
LVGLVLKSRSTMVTLLMSVKNYRVDGDVDDVDGMENRPNRPSRRHYQHMV